VPARLKFLFLKAKIRIAVVHQLFLDENSLGIILFDSFHPKNPFCGVGLWQKALRKVAGDDCPRLLVAGRVDRGAPTVTNADIQSFLKEYGFSGYIATSAKTGQGVNELHSAIAKYIPWDKLPVTRSPELWKKIREYLPDRRKVENILTLKSAAIIIGKQGIGKWQILELRIFISRCVEEDIPVIPVLLPGVSKIPPDLSFLRELNWVKFKEKIEETEALDNLEWGITGKKPHGMGDR